MDGWIQFPDMSRPDTLQKKYVGKLSRRALNFVKSVLQMEPSDRSTSRECVEHAYFEDIATHNSNSSNSNRASNSRQGSGGGGGGGRGGGRRPSKELQQQQQQQQRGMEAASSSNN